MPPTPLRIALDWTPNTLHSGLFLALTHNLYAAANLDVQLLSPGPDYTLTPARRVERGEADLALCPSESLIAYAESGKLSLQAIYAVLQTDASAIVSTNPEVRRVGDLAGRGYGSYNARYEDSIVRAMVANDGGDGSSLRIAGQKGKLTLFEAVKRGEVDATWVFLPWEGVEAAMEGVELKVFRPEEGGVAYGYSPVIARNANSGISDEVLRAFVKATREGYAMAVRDPGSAVGVLKGVCEPERGEEFLRRSQESVNGFMGGVEGLGRMSGERWEGWVGWLEERGLVEKGKVKVEGLWSNEFFD